MVNTTRLATRFTATRFGIIALLLLVVDSAPATASSEALASELPKIPKACFTGILIALDSDTETLITASPTPSTTGARSRRFLRRGARPRTRVGTKLDAQPERLKWHLPGVHVGDFWVGN